VVLQVLAHTWQVLDDVDAVLLQNLAVTNAEISSSCGVLMAPADSTIFSA